MNSLFRNVLVRGKDSLLKESLQTQLAACVRDIQLDHAQSGRFQSSSEAADALCTVIEAIFIHGIKETLADKLAIAMGDPDTRPEPNFWPALLIFSHREIIDQIGALNFISTDIGRCRAWIRTALNENLLSSYLQSMLSQNVALNSFYKRAAYLRDKELLDTFITHISGIEVYSFTYACNSSLLNMWTNQPLLMSGVWSPAMKSSSITSGTDIARSLMMEDSASKAAEDSLSSVSVASYYESSLGSSSFDEDEALKIILSTDMAQSFDQSEPDKLGENYVYGNKHNEVNDVNKPECSERLETNMEAAEAVQENTSEDNRCDLNTEAALGGVNVCEPLETTGSTVEYRKRKLQSYRSLVQSYNNKSTSSSKMPDLQDLLQKFQMPSQPLTEVQSSTEGDFDMLDKLGFEFVLDDEDISGIPEFKLLLQHINRIATEQGLDSQNYICRTCTQHIGINFGPAKVCGLTGAYYCSECFGTDVSSEYWVIPARVIFNWDFQRYSVSHRAAEFLSQIQFYPLFDISVINPKVYSAVEEMTRLKELRIRLNFLRDYLFTCREDNFKKYLQMSIWPRDYLFEKLHYYSLKDLIEVPTGELEALLQKAVDMSRKHVVSCTLCSLKGFICEICNNPKVIFPFDLDTTYRCKNCSAVYHAECLQAGQLCPKCLRIQQRELTIQES